MVSKEFAVLAAAVLSLTVGGAVATNGVSAAPGSSKVGIDGRGWPGASTGDAAKALRSARSDAHGRVLAFLEVPPREAFVDVGEPGESTGDTIFFESDLMSLDGTRRLGSDSVRCTLSITTFFCDGTFKIFGKGTITAYAALFPHDQSIRIPVTGGTGRYRGTSGDLHVVDHPDGITTLVFHLTD